MRDDAFKDDLGQFSELVFRQLISESGYTEDSYVEGTRQDLAREQMVETISTSLIIPNIMKDSLSKYNLEERTVDYLTIKVEEEKFAKIKMTLTTPNCPVAESLPKEVKQGAMQVEGIEDVDLELVWDPPWNKDMMSEAAKLELNL